MNIKNFTPHTVNIVDRNTEISHSFKSEGDVRLSTKFGEKIEEWNKIPVYNPPEYTDIVGIPEYLLKNKEEKIGIIVSMPVGIFISEHRNDFPEHISVYGPDTSPENVIRDEKRLVSGSYAFIKYK
jgi:hypothetical protein